MPKKTFPDHTLEKAVRAAGAECLCLWEERGPKNTEVAWMVAYSINGAVVIVQTFNGGGWEVYMSARSTHITGTVREVLERCGFEAGADRQALHGNEVA